MYYSCTTFLFVYCVLVFEVSCYQTHTALNSIVFTNIPSVKADVHSEYYFGKCATRYRQLLVHDHLTYEQIVGNLLVRGYLNVTREPNCVYVKASSAYGDMVRYNAYKFTMCLSKIVHNYTGLKFTYYFYEWYIPVELQRGINWDLYFFAV